MPQQTFDVSAALKEGYSQEDINSFMKSKGLMPKISSESSQFALGGTPGEVGIRAYNSGDAVRDTASKLITPLSVLGGILGGLFGSSSIAGTGLGASTGAAIGSYIPRRMAGEKPSIPLLGEVDTGSKALDAGLDIGSNTLLNEATGKLFGAGVNVVKEAVTPGSIVGKIAELKPTYSQMTGNKAAGLVEGVFAPGAKESTEIASEKLINQKVKEFTSQLAGGRPVTKQISENLANSVATDAKTIYSGLLKESSKYGGKVDGISLSPKNISTFQNQATGATGSIDPSYAIKVAMGVKQEIAQTYGNVDPALPILKDIDSFLTQMKVQYDPTDPTKVISYDPAQFDRMWATKQDWQDKAFGKNLTDMTVRDFRYGTLTRAIDKSIQDSTLQWADRGAEANFNYTAAKKIAAFRHRTFQGSLQKLANLADTQLPDPYVNQVLNNYKELQKALISGKLTVNGVSQRFAGLAGDLKALQISNLVDAVKSETDPTDLLKGKLNGTKLLEDWTQYANSKAGNLLYNANNRADITQFFKNVSSIEPQGGHSGLSRYLTMKIGFSGVTLGAGLIDAFALQQANSLHSLIGSSAIIGAAISLHGLGKLLTNPTSARLMVAASSGAPLGMSATAASRIISQVLRDDKINLMLSDGRQIETKKN